MGNFVHLHVHTEFSLLDGAARIKDLIAAAKQQGQRAIAITDHGVMFGAMNFYKEAKANGIKPIIGCEVYEAARTRFDKQSEYDAQNYHLVLLAKNMLGYQNLINIVSKAYVEGFYSKPRVDLELLREHSEGIIALSACIAGKIPQMIIQGNYAKAKEEAQKYIEIFGKENFFLEIQDHGIIEQKQVNSGILDLATELGIKMVATNDVHYIKKEDNKLHDVLMCIQMNKTINDESRFGFEFPEFYLKSEEEMEELFDGFDGAIENTWLVADMCELEFEFGNLHLPEFKVPDGFTQYEYLKNLCNDGYKSRFGDSKEHIERLEYELETIKQMGYVDYFLIVHDFIKYAKDNGIPVGPGRGSAAGSIVSYCLRITDVDPIKYNLIFERFLNPERVSMPDIDIDFCYERRGEVIEYVKEKYGNDHVAQIITFGTMAAKGAIRDVGRALDMPYSDVDAIAKLVPNELNIKLNRALDISRELRQAYDSDPKVKELLDTAKGAEGMARHSSTHAAGVVITKSEVYRHVPIAQNDESIVTQYTMGTLEELGLLKMDFLGLRTLTVIDNAIKLIQKKGVTIDLDNLDYDDAPTYELISSGMTDGIFQLESAGMKQVLTGLKPKNLEDIIAVISLYRPGPMDSIPRYIECKNNPQKITYKHPILEEILNMTYGCIVYQEQVMEIVRKMGGYSLGRSDLVRRAMSKKKHDVMEKERANFVEGAAQRGVSKEVAQSVFDEMIDFASYAFNKSHAAAYALIAYQTAYLKCHYKEEFMAALLTSVLDSTDKIIEYIDECQKLKIDVLPPDINESAGVFTVSGSNIRFSLVAVKGIGRGFIKNLIEERDENGSFKSFYDFCKRMCGKELNKRAMENLIKCGAFDSFNNYRSQLLLVYENVMDSIMRDEKKNLEGQVGLFDMMSDISDEDESNDIELPDVPDMPMREKLEFERLTMGLFISGHPIKQFASCIKNDNMKRIKDIIEKCDEGDYVRVGGVIMNRKTKITKNNATMCFFNLQDVSATTEVIVFPKVYERLSDKIKDAMPVVINARVSIKDDEAPKLILDDITILEEEDIALNRNTKVYIKLNSKEREKTEMIKKILYKNKGGTAVYIYYEDLKKNTLTPSNLWIMLNKDVIEQLKSVANDENVEIVKK